MKKNKTHISDRKTRAFKSNTKDGDLKREFQTTPEWPNKPEQLQSETPGKQKTEPKSEQKLSKLQLRSSLRNAGSSQLRYWAEQKNSSGKTEESSSKKWIEFFIIGVLVVALGFFLVRNIKFSSGATTSERADNVVSSLRKKIAEVKINWSIPPVFSSDIHDPMQFAAIAAIPYPQIQVVQKLQVTGIMGSPEKRLAVVGSDIVAEGDIVEGAIVIKINQDSVEFEKDNERWVEPVTKGNN